MRNLNKIIDKRGRIIAIIIKRNFLSKKRTFFSDEKDLLQIGFLKFKRKEKVRAHIHRIKKVTSMHQTQEILIIKKGKIKVHIYLINKKIPFFKTILKQGDLIIFLAGGHSLEFLDDTEIIEIKEGPYEGKEKDKYYI